MKKFEVEKMDKAQKGRIAVAYLMQDKKERPEGSERFFEKLDNYEKSLREIVGAIEESKNTMMNLQMRADQMMGSISSVVELIHEDLPEEKLSEWCEKYNHPENMPKMNMPGGKPMGRPGPADMAGSTAKMNNQPATVETPPGFNPQR